MFARGLKVGHTRTRARRERGVVAVEFALVLPVLVALMFGVFTAGAAYSDHLSVTNAVREAARFGGAVDSTDPTVWANSVKDRVGEVYMNGLGTLSPGQICVVLRDSSGALVAEPASQGTCGSEPGPPSVVSSGSCVVKVWVEKPAKISMLVFNALNFTIRAESVSFYGRETTACPGS
jgi:hypothetical protein